MNEDLPFDLVSLSSDDVQALEDTYNALKARFNISLSDDRGIHIKQFELLNVQSGCCNWRIVVDPDTEQQLSFNFSENTSHLLRRPGWGWATRFL